MKSVNAIVVFAAISMSWFGSPLGVNAFDADGTYIAHGTG